MGLEEPEKRGIQSYEQGQWLEVQCPTSNYWGRFVSFENGDLVLSDIVRDAITQKGLECVQLTGDHVIGASHLSYVGPVSEDIVKGILKNLAPTSRWVGKYVLIEANNTEHYGKVNIITPGTAILSPYLGFSYSEKGRKPVIKKTERHLKGPFTCIEGITKKEFERIAKKQVRLAKSKSE